MTQYLPPNLLALFAPREPIPYLPPAQKLPHEKKTRGYQGVGHFLNNFEDPKDTPLPARMETREERIERKRRERAEQAAYKLEQGIALWDPHSNSNGTSDPYKTLFVARINYDSTETKLRREFEAYGPIKKIALAQDKVSGKPRGYAFIEFEHEREMHSAYKHADGKKIDGKRVLVDVERGRTVKGWLPRRLGGGLGGTRKGAPDENIRHSGRDDNRSAERDRYDKESSSRRHSRDRDRTEKRRSRSKDREREREKRRRSKSPKERERDRGDRDSTRERRSRYEGDRRRGDERRSRSNRDQVVIEEQVAGGDGVERRRSDSRDKDVERSRKRRKSRSHSRERKRSHRNDFENNNKSEKMDSIKNDVIKEEPEEGLYANPDMYDNDEPFPTGFGENSNSSSFDQFQAQNYSQPTYVAYTNNKEDLYSP